MNLADQLSAYAVKLLDKVRGHKELDCVLGKTGKESEEKYVLLARLYLAIKYEEKPVRIKYLMLLSKYPWRIFFPITIINDPIW